METTPKKDQAASPTEASEDKKKKAALSDSNLWMNITAWAALVGIAAGTILMLITFFQVKPDGRNPVNYQESGQEISPRKLNSAINSKNEDSTEPADAFEPEQDLLSTLKLPSQNSFINTERPAVSVEPLESSAPMLKFMPLAVALSSSRSTAFFEIRNDGNADLVFNLSTNNSLISASPASGTLKSDQKAKITVTGYAEGIVIIDSNGGHDVVTVNYQ